MVDGEIMLDGEMVDEMVNEMVDMNKDHCSFLTINHPSQPTN